MVRAVVARRPGAWDRLLSRAGESLFGLVAEALGGDAESEYLALLEKLREDDFRLLREYDGRARLESYLRLCAADLLGARILERFDDDPSGAWRGFERMFRPELVRVIRQCFPEGGSDADSRDDVYQELCYGLLADDFRRLRAFDGRGRLSAYVRRVSRNLCADLRRRTLGRLRLPEALRRGSAPEQEAYKLLHWRGLSAEEAIEVLTGSGTPATHEEARDAVLRATRLPGPTRPTRASLLEEPPDPGPSPEERVLAAESEAGHELDLQRLEAAVSALAPEERLYVRLRFFETPPASPREIAHRMGRTPREVYKLRDRVMAALRIAVRTTGAKPGGVRPRVGGD